MFPRNEIFETLLRFRKVFYTVGFFTAVINILMLAPSLYMMEVYDRVLSSHNEYTLYMLSLLAIGLYALLSALDYIRSAVIIRIGLKIDASLNERVYNAAFQQNLGSNSINAGQALNDLTTIRQFLTGSGIFAFFDAPWFPVYLLIIFLFNPWLGIFAFISTSTLIGLAWINEFISRKSLSEANSVALRSFDMVSNNLRNAEVIEAMGMLPNMRSRWHKEHQVFLELQAEASQNTSKIAAITKFVRVCTQSLILGVAALLVIKGQVTSGMMIAASILLGRAITPVEQIISVWRQWSSVLSSYKRLEQLLSINPPRNTNMALPKPTGALNVEMVSASPPGAKLLALKNVNFSLNPGDCLGLIGPSGSGKSTLARLLVGVWPAAGGAVRLDGANVYQWNKDELGPSIGYLPQDVELFAGTIAENIARFGTINPEKVVKAAELAGIHEMILQMPQGYDTHIGDGGIGLSGGEKQRIGLARALFDNPALIVLDEPNSNLDEVGDQALAHTIAKLKELKRTIVLITHKPNIIRETNLLLFLQNGVALAFGPTDRVLEDLKKFKSQQNLRSNKTQGGDHV